VTPSLSFQWLGVAGLVFETQGQSLAIDPFLTRPPLRYLLSGRPTSDHQLAAKCVPRCDHVLVTHAHWDHLMDVPAVVSHTGARAYGSPQACKLLTLLGLPQERALNIAVGDRLDLGTFDVEVVPARHPPVPPPFSPGPLCPGLRPPLRLADYRMDECFGFSIRTQGMHFLVSPAHGTPADFLFANVPAALRSPRRLLADTRPRWLVPVHWDNLFKPLRAAPLAADGSKPPRWIRGSHSWGRILIPDRFRVYDLAELP
jgi:L-ascorbate metabolism protein UlaG (beta-lactamase superfamily)